jgi:hypothetical protein
MRKIQIVYKCSDETEHNSKEAAEAHQRAYEHADYLFKISNLSIDIDVLCTLLEVGCKHGVVTLQGFPTHVDDPA